MHIDRHLSFSAMPELGYFPSAVPRQVITNNT